MGQVAIAVGCAVGIPIGVGIIIAGIFWYRLQRRFEKELNDDKELENEIYNDSPFINVNNLNSLRVENDNDQDNKTRPQSNVYIPAYRKKINSLQWNHYLETNNNNNNNNHNNNEDDNSIYANHPPSHILSDSSLNISTDLNNQQRQISVYDQMVPFVKPQSSNILNDSKQNIIEHISMQSDSTINNNSDTLIKNFQNQDLGSYYPMVQPYSTNASFQNFKSNNSNSSLNIFNTPNSKKTLNQNQIQNQSKLNQVDSDLDSILQDSIHHHEINHNNLIEEEDQYENEFTNYRENRRQFLDSLRPN